MNQENDFGSLFPNWYPFGPVARLLRGIGLRDEETYLFEAPFKEFRYQTPGNPLRLPEDIRTSDDWRRLLFNISIDGEPNPGFFGQINLDNIGRDFLCLIYHRQRVLDLFREGGLRQALSMTLRETGWEPPEFTNLTNSLIPVEALTDFLALRGTDFSPAPGEEAEPAIILSDPPVRHLTLQETPSPVKMLRDSTNLSRYIRRLSVCLQDGGQWEDLSRLTPGDFSLSETTTELRDRRTAFSTRNFALYVAMSREFCLWDINRGMGFPSIRQISDRKGIPYLELLRVVEWGFNNLESGGIHRFDGLRFLTNGFSDRLVQILANRIKMRTTTSTSNPEEQ